MVLMFELVWLELDVEVGLYCEAKARSSESSLEESEESPPLRTYLRWLGRRVSGVESSQLEESDNPELSEPAELNREGFFPARENLEVNSLVILSTFFFFSVP